MSLGLGVLRHSPETFWRMTLRELLAAVDPHLGETSAPLRRGELEALMQKYPDN